jgi:hypothetical protein
MTLWLACGEGVGLSTDVPDADVLTYDVLVRTEPEEVEAGQTVELFATVVDQLERPVPDLQTVHERMLHSVFVSRDLASFQHVHHEDFGPVTADDLRAGTFHFPIAFPAAGDTLAIFDFAHRNVFLQDTVWLAVGGSPPQADAPALDFALERAAEQHVATLRWTSPPRAGIEAIWTFHLVDDTGSDVVDLVPWLGADGHVVMVRDDLSWARHTHAWVEGLDTMAPNMTMPHVYDGPELEFRATFPTAGAYAVWLQFARSAAPDAPFTIPFAVEVAP